MATRYPNVLLVVVLNDRDYQGDKIDPTRPYRPFDSRVKNLSDYCDVVKKQVEELRPLDVESAGLEYYSVEFDKLTKLFEREKK